MTPYAVASRRMFGAVTEPEDHIVPGAPSTLVGVTCWLRRNSGAVCDPASSPYAPLLRAMLRDGLRGGLWAVKAVVATGALLFLNEPFGDVLGEVGADALVAMPWRCSCSSRSTAPILDAISS